MNDVKVPGGSQPVDKPWLAREDWARGVVADASGTYSRNVLWFLAFMANLLCIPSGMVLYWELGEKAPHLLWLALIPPCLSIAVLLRAVFVTFLRKETPTRFELHSLPGVLGGHLRGTLLTRMPLRKATELRFVLYCEETWESSGKKRGRLVNRDPVRRQLMNREVLYREEGRLPLEEVAFTGREYTLPVEVGIPYTCKETALPRDGRQIRWNLVLTATMPKGSVEAWFEVPVFRTAESDPDYRVSTTAARSTTVAESAYDRTPTYGGVRVNPGPGAATFYFGPARMKEGALGNTIFTLVLCGITVGLYLADVNRIVVVLLGAVSAVFCYGTLHFWLYISALRVERGRLTVRKGILGLGVPKRFQREEIRDIKPERTGRKGERQETVYYNLILVLNNKKEVPLAYYLIEKAHARWLAGRIMTAIEQA